MTREEAVGMIGAIRGAWPTLYLDDYGMQAWEGFLVGRDYDLTMKAYVRLSERQRDLPTIADFRSMIIAMESDRRAAMPKIEEPSFVREIPAWTKGWTVARYKHQDFRVFPQQKVGYDSHQIANPSHRTYVWPDQEMMSPEDVARYIEEGAPLKVAEIVGLITS